MTEISYSISDIQTRIFEIQELRHKSQSSGETADSNITTIIDQQLMTLDERLETVQKGMKAIAETLEPFMQTAATPTVSENGSGSENAALLRKHATLVQEWQSIQEESETLREELKEDKWLTVFRTVTDQADGMMSSLEKAVNRCQEFIWQVHRRGTDDFQSNASMPSSRSEKLPLTLDSFTTLLDSFEAKKKHYMPATSKVLSIIDKGVRDRVTKNGETLRRHAESAQRWKNLRERITRTEKEMENVRKILTGDSDYESTTSGTASTKGGYLATPPSASRVSRISSSGSMGMSISGSMSPLRRIANKITGSKKSSPISASVSPLFVSKKSLPPAKDPQPSTGGTLRRQRTSIFGPVHAGPPLTPERAGHKHSQSYTPDSSPRGPKLEKLDLNATIRSSSSKQKWNASTKVETDIKGVAIRKPPSRSPSSQGYYSRDDIPPVPPIGTPYRRSASRTSMASSRPWSPISSSYSTTQSSNQVNYPPVSMQHLRTPSRAQTPSRAITPSLAVTPRSRPKTPSHIPAPKALRSISGTIPFGGWDDEESPPLPRSHSPAFSTSAQSASGSHYPRPPSRSMIPVPTVHLNTPSRPGSSMSSFNRSESPNGGSRTPFKSTALRAQTPDHTLRARAQQVPIFQGTIGRSGGRQPLPKLPPSSFRDGTSSGVSSRPSSRSGAHTPSGEGSLNGPLHEYIPGSNYDPLDVEVATIANSLPHGLLVERVDPPLKRSQVPKEGEEIKAQYAFSNALARKVVTCKLTTLTRSGKSGDSTTKKVMCRVGGGWQDLSHYILNRQAGM
ncbi:hypothetical protein CPB83DRAFT_763453 [Crepidotus variabilis]|uniref:GAR domain-containing protein n=1 Tax=Crepidotus variabilis TaxID=179855 RepID=A0A9P6EIS1_9AGAR|nr:hypothetical protein CPB83DRAFT_763453 [Crepidotus variabilis]